MLLGAAYHLRARKPGVGKWISRSMALAPRWASPHTMAAKALWDVGRDRQALLEIREAAKLDPYRAANTLCAQVLQDEEVSRILRATPPSRVRKVAFLDSVHHCVRHNAKLAQAVDKTLLELDPPHRKAVIREAGRLAKAGKGHAALETLAKVSPEMPGRHVAPRVAALALITEGEHQQAIDLLTVELQRSDVKHAELLRVLALAHTRAQNADAMREVITRLKGYSGVEGDSLSRAMQLLAQFELELENPAKALAALDEAYKIGR